MDQDDPPHDLVEDQIVFDNQDPIAQSGKSLVVRDFSEVGITGEPLQIVLDPIGQSHCRRDVVGGDKSCKILKVLFRDGEESDCVPICTHGYASARSS